jgi:hypothetical protein
MANFGSPDFKAYARTLRRLMSADAMQSGLELARRSRFRASLIKRTLNDAGSDDGNNANDLTRSLDYHRHRTASDGGETT